MSGIVYILTNPAMPGLVKIGRTTHDDPAAHIKDLYTAGVPAPFKCVKAVWVDDEAAVEKALHAAFRPYRLNRQRQFFEIDEAQASVLLEQLGAEDITSEVNAGRKKQADKPSRTTDKQRSRRRPSLNFMEMSIPIGSVLTAVDTDEIVEVTGPKSVEFRGEEMSLTAATKIMLNFPRNIRPTPLWRFRGKLLSDIYDQTYGPADTD